MPTLTTTAKNIPVKKKKTGNSLITNFKKRKVLYYMAIPGLIFYLVFRYAPMFGIIVAFQNYNPFEGVSAFWTSEFVGFHWFQILFTQPEFWQLLRNTLLISLYFIIFGFPAPIILALLLNEVRNAHFKRISQTITYIPHFLSWALVGGIIIQMLSPDHGLVNNILGLFGFKPNYFLSNPHYFRGIVVGSGIWKEVGWDSIIYLAAIAGIDPTLYEAAIIDGANRWKQVIYVTIPSILPVITILLILSFGRVMETGFDEIYMFISPYTQKVGDVFSTYSLRVGIRNAQYSYITALGLFQNVVNLIILLICNKISKTVSESSLW
jgi:putative aldouronate transport system permease protein